MDKTCEYIMNLEEKLLCNAYAESKRTDGRFWANFPECNDENCPKLHPELLEGAILQPKPKLISTWAELKECTSETHVLEIKDNCCGWIRPKVESKENERDHHYLSTHTFYGGNHKWSTKILQQCGFNVEIANWDEIHKVSKSERS